MKTCSCCKTEKTEGEFYKDSKGIGGLRSNCILCQSHNNRLGRLKRKTEPKMVPFSRKCPGCKIEKPAFSFSISTSSKTGLCSYCKKCVSVRGFIERRKYPIQTMLCKAKSRSKAKNIPFSLTEQDIVIPEFCPILGVKLEQGGGSTIKDTANSPSLDRIIPELGYVPGNVQVISNLANFMKRDAALSVLRTFAKSILRLYPEPANTDAALQEPTYADEISESLRVKPLRAPVAALLLSL